MAGDPKDPRGDPLPSRGVSEAGRWPWAARWRGWLWGMLGGGVALGLVAWAIGGAVQAVALAALMLCGLGVAAAMAARPQAVQAATVGGAGYDVPPARSVVLLHFAITLLYVTGILVAAISAMARLDALDVQFTAAARGLLALGMGLLVALVALAAQWRLRELGGSEHTWATKANGWALAVAGAAVTAAAAATAARPSIQVAGRNLLSQADIPVLVLVMLLGVTTQAFLALRLPTPLGLLAGMREAFRESREQSASQTPPFVHALMLALGVTAVLGFLLLQFDVLSTLGNFRDQRVGLLLLLFPLALAAFFTVSGVQIWRESKRGLYAQRMSAKLRTSLLVYGLSSAVGLALSVILVMNLTGRIDHLGPFRGDTDLSKDLIAATIICTAGPIGWYSHAQTRRVDNIESRLPDFLNDLAETKRAGLTLAAALQSTSLSDYGDLSPEIRKMAHQVAWGVPFTEALEQFAERVQTSLVKRITYLIIEASKTGGSVAEILKAAAKDAYEIKALEQDRRITMLTYLIVIYVVFFVFLTVIAVLDLQFIPHVLRANAAAAEAGTGGPVGGSTSVDQEAIRFVYFNAAMVQAIGNGLVGGVLAEGRIAAGLRHVAIMATMSWLVFRILLAV